MRNHDLEGVAGPETVRNPVGKKTAADPFDSHHPVVVGWSGTERVIAPNFFAVDYLPKSKVLACPEFENVAKFRRDFKADRIGLCGLLNNLSDLQLMKVDAHYQVASG